VTDLARHTHREARAHEERLQMAVDAIRADAGSRDRASSPDFPSDAFAHLRRADALGFNAWAGTRRPPAEMELSLVRRIACADASVGRIFDGHLNAIERLAVHGPPPLAERELIAVAEGELLAGVWGGEPRDAEGDPAAVVATAAGEVLRGVKTFCSGAGGLQRAAVLARDPCGDAPLLVWIDLTDERSVSVDRTWYRGAGLVASESHRVQFDDAPVLARLGGPGAISHQPWFARDALRTAASWCGMADSAAESALDELASRPAAGDLEALAAGRILTARQTIDAWLARAADAMDVAASDLPAVALHGRAAISAACRTLLDEAARACGSHPFARGGDLDRARRDLELFLFQHRLDPLLARAGATELKERACAT
jgi:alkylation response protein AidB-like acyl-CoA dehydrogenase